MEITDILRSNNSNLNSAQRTLNKRTDDSFQQLLKKNLKTESSNIHSIDNKKTDKKLMDVCIEMESIFVGKMLKEMRNTLPQEKLIDGGFAEKVFEDMLYDEYALNLSKTSNLGLARILYNELSRK